MQLIFFNRLPLLSFHVWYPACKQSFAYGKQHILRHCGFFLCSHVDETNWHILFIQIHSSRCRDHGPRYDCFWLSLIACLSSALLQEWVNSKLGVQVEWSCPKKPMLGPTTDDALTFIAVSFWAVELDRCALWSMFMFSGRATPRLVQRGKKPCISPPPTPRGLHFWLCFFCTVLNSTLLIGILLREGLWFKFEPHRGNYASEMYLERLFEVDEIHLVVFVFCI